MKGKTLLTITREDLIDMAAKDRRALNIFAVTQAKVQRAADKDSSVLIEEILETQKAQFEQNGRDAVAEAVQTKFEESAVVDKVEPPDPKQEEVKPDDTRQIDLLKTLHKDIKQILSMLEGGIRVVDVEEEGSTDEEKVEEKKEERPDPEKKEKGVESELSGKVELAQILRGDLAFILKIASEVGALNKVEVLKGDINAMRRALISHLEEMNYFSE